MYALGIDVCLGHCSVALVEGSETMAVRSEAMARGHVERLAPMVSDVLRSARVEADALGIVGVTCGPGGFTGARLGIAYARGLALAVGCQAVGITTFEGLASPHAEEDVIVALDGRRGVLFVQFFRSGIADADASVISVDQLPRFVHYLGSPRVIGPTPVTAIDPADVARLAAGQTHSKPPLPLYLRAPDAKAASRPVLR